MSRFAWHVASGDSEPDAHTVAPFHCSPILPFPLMLVTAIRNEQASSLWCVVNRENKLKIPSYGRLQRLSDASDENLLPGVYVYGNGEKTK